MLLSELLQVLFMFLFQLVDQLLVLLLVIWKSLWKSILFISHSSHDFVLSLSLSFRFFNSKVLKKGEKSPCTIDVVHVSNESLLALMLITVGPWDVALANCTCQWHLRAFRFQVIFPRSLVPENSIWGTSQTASEFRFATFGLVCDSVGVGVVLITQVAVHLDLD